MMCSNICLLTLVHQKFICRCQTLHIHDAAHGVLTCPAHTTARVRRFEPHVCQTRCMPTVSTNAI